MIPRQSVLSPRLTFPRLVLVISLTAGVGTYWYARRSKPPAVVPGSIPVIASARLPSASARAETTATASAGLGPDASQAEKLAWWRRRFAHPENPGFIEHELEGIAGTDPALALQLAREFARNDWERHIFLSVVVRGWAYRDPAAAWQWALQNSSAYQVSGGQSLSGTVLAAAAENDPHLLIGFANEGMKEPSDNPWLEPSRLTHDAVTALMLAGHRDLARTSLTEWSKKVPADRIGQIVMEVALQQYEKPPAEVAAWVQTFPPSEARTQALATAAANWVKQEPVAAMDWAFSLQPADGREHVMQGAFLRWANRDIEGATQWLAQHEMDSATDYMITTIVTGDEKLVANHPRAALTWAEAILDRNQRLQTIEPVLVAWNRQDPSAAIRYVVESKAFSEPERQQLVELLRNPAPAPAPSR